MWSRILRVEEQWPAASVTRCQMWFGFNWPLLKGFFRSRKKAYADFFYLSNDREAIVVMIKEKRYALLVFGLELFLKRGK